MNVYLLVTGTGDSVRLRLSEDGVHALPTPRENAHAAAQRERARAERLLAWLAAQGIEPPDDA